METLIHKKMIEIMREVTAVEKNRRNQSQGYAFRGIDDMYNMLHDIMAAIGVYCVARVIGDTMEERTNSKGTILIYRILRIEFDFVAEDGSKVTTSVIGEGMDSGDKASNKAMSVAQKYALIQAFLIPTEDTKDPENDSHEIRVAEHAAKLIKMCKDKLIEMHTLTAWLVRTKRIPEGKDARFLDDDRAKKMLEHFDEVVAEIKK